MKGKGVGTGTIIFTADAAEAGLGAPGKWIRSVPKRISVYPPLSVDPKNLTLLIGSVYQVIPHGGPQTDVIVEFHSGKAFEILSVCLFHKPFWLILSTLQ